MRLIPSSMVLAVTGAMLSIAPAAFSADTAVLEQRIARLESINDSRQEIQLINRLEELQQQVQMLQGTFDEVKYQMQSLEARQRDLYRDLDRRIANMQTQAGNQKLSTSEPSSSFDLDASTPSIVTKKEKPTQPVVSNKLAISTPEFVVPKPVANVELTPAFRRHESATEAYKEAYDELKNKDYGKATALFKQFLADFNDSKLIPNATYWLGEINLVGKNTEHAIVNFQEVINRYPAHPKAGDALLKLGYAYAAQGNIDQAKHTLRKVKQDYKGTALAQLASNRLSQLN